MEPARALQSFRRVGSNALLTAYPTTLTEDQDEAVGGFPLIGPSQNCRSTEWRLWRCELTGVALRSDYYEHSRDRGDGY